MQERLLAPDSQYRTNIEQTDGTEYKSTPANPIQINGPVRLGQPTPQNSQYTPSQGGGGNKFICVDENGIETNVTFEGRFETMGDFVKYPNATVLPFNIKMIYTSYPYEIGIQHLEGKIFGLGGYDAGTFLGLIGYDKVNQGQNVYTNINTPKLFSQSPIYTPIEEFGHYNTTTKGSKPYTYLVISQPGFGVVANINTTFANTFYVDNKNLNELAVKIKDSDGLAFVNNKGNANAILVLSY